MRRRAPIILLALIVAVVVLSTIAGRVYQYITSPRRAPILLPLAPAPSPATSGGQPGASSISLFPGVAGEELRAALHDYAAAGHDPLGYRRAREIVYWQLDHVDGEVVTIYERRRIELDSAPTTGRTVRTARRCAG